MIDGLQYLKQQIQKNSRTLLDNCQVSIIPFYCLIDRMIQLLKKYLHKPICNSWGQYLVVVLNQKQLSDMFVSWIYYHTKSMEIKLMTMLLNTREIELLEMFVKVRKLVIKANRQSWRKCLDDILLEMQDIVGILHSSFMSMQTKRMLSEGIKQLFLSYKIQQAKIYSCVFIQYILSIYQNIKEMEYGQANINHHVNIGRDKREEVYYHEDVNGEKMGNSNNIGINAFKSEIHQQNGLYRKYKTQRNQQKGLECQVKNNFRKLFMKSKNKSLNKKNQIQQIKFINNNKTIQQTIPTYKLINHQNQNPKINTNNNQKNNIESIQHQQFSQRSKTINPFKKYAEYIRQNNKLITNIINCKYVNEDNQNNQNNQNNQQNQNNQNNQGGSGKDQNREFNQDKISNKKSQILKFCHLLKGNNNGSIERRMSFDNPPYKKFVENSHKHVYKQQLKSDKLQNNLPTADKKINTIQASVVRHSKIGRQTKPIIYNQIH